MRIRFTHYQEGEARGPSLADYLQLAAGSSCGRYSDQVEPGDDGITRRCPATLWNQLESSGRSWGVYREGMPSPCSPAVTHEDDASDGKYALKHNPATPFKSVYDDPVLCRAHVLPYTPFDPAKLPDLSFISPNGCNDMHGSGSERWTKCRPHSPDLIERGDRWLAARVPAMLAHGAGGSGRTQMRSSRWDGRSPVSWKPEVDGIEERRRRAAELGGPEAVARQRELGRLTIRERIAALVEPGSFREHGPIAGEAETDAEGRLVSFQPANYVVGVARVDGRPVVVGGEDFTQRGGSPSPGGLRKSIYAEDLACQSRLPLVRFLQGGGGSVTGASGKGPSRPDPVNSRHRFESIGRAMAQAPVVSAAVGAVAGFPAARLVASHFSLMTRHGAQVMVAGPAVVERALGEKLSKQELGGAEIHGRSGVVDNVVEDEAEAIDAIRRFLAYLPTNVWELPPVLDCDDPRDRCEEELLSIVPRERRRIYPARRLLQAIVDAGSFFEMSPGYGRSQITGLARLAGRPVGIWANDPRFSGGAMTADGARKIRRFVDLCDVFHLPVVCFVDEPGFMLGLAAEKAATIRFGAEALFAVVQSRVPWASVVVRRTYGVAAAAHFGPDAYVLAWPSAVGGALPLEGGVAVAFGSEIAAAPDPVARRRELEEGLAARRDPYSRAEAFGVHDLIDPRRTRPALCDWIEWVEPRLRTQLGERHYAIRP